MANIDDLCNRCNRVYLNLKCNSFFYNKHPELIRYDILIMDKIFLLSRLVHAIID